MGATATFHANQPKKQLKDAINTHYLIYITFKVPSNYETIKEERVPFGANVDAKKRACVRERVGKKPW